MIKLEFDQIAAVGIAKLRILKNYFEFICFAINPCTILSPELKMLWDIPCTIGFAHTAKERKRRKKPFHVYDFRFYFRLQNIWQTIKRIYTPHRNEVIPGNSVRCLNSAKGLRVNLRISQFTCIFSGFYFCVDSRTSKQKRFQCKRREHGTFSECFRHRDSRTLALINKTYTHTQTHAHTHSSCRVIINRKSIAQLFEISAAKIMIDQK